MTTPKTDSASVIAPSDRWPKPKPAETVAPADLLGRQVLVVANLAPRKLMGLESHGMLLVAEDAEGRRVPMHPARTVPAGVQVK